MKIKPLITCLCISIFSAPLTGNNSATDEVEKIEKEELPNSKITQIFEKLDKLEAKFEQHTEAQNKSNRGIWWWWKVTWPLSINALIAGTAVSTLALIILKIMFKETGPFLDNVRRELDRVESDRHRNTTWEGIDITIQHGRGSTSQYNPKCRSR